MASITERLSGISDSVRQQASNVAGWAASNGFVQSGLDTLKNNSRATGIGAFAVGTAVGVGAIVQARGRDHAREHTSWASRVQKVVGLAFVLGGIAAGVDALRGGGNLEKLVTGVIDAGKSYGRA